LVTYDVLFRHYDFMRLLTFLFPPPPFVPELWKLFPHGAYAALDDRCKQSPLLSFVPDPFSASLIFCSIPERPFCSPDNPGDVSEISRPPRITFLPYPLPSFPHLFPGGFVAFQNQANEESPLYRSPFPPFFLPPASAILRMNQSIKEDFPLRLPSRMKKPQSGAILAPFI